MNRANFNGCNALEKLFFFLDFWQQDLHQQNALHSLREITRNEKSLTYWDNRKLS